MATDELLNIEIITPQKTLYSAKAQSVSLPGSQSPFQVLPKHAPIVSALDPGIVKVVDDNGNTLFFAVSGGFAEVKTDKVSVLVDKALASDDINTIFAAELILQAKKILSEAKHEEEKKMASLQVQFAEACIKIDKKNS